MVDDISQTAALREDMLGRRYVVGDTHKTTPLPPVQGCTRHKSDTPEGEEIESYEARDQQPGSEPLLLDGGEVTVCK